MFFVNAFLKNWFDLISSEQGPGLYLSPLTLVHLDKRALARASAISGGEGTMPGP